MRAALRRPSKSESASTAVGALLGTMICVRPLPSGEYELRASGVSCYSGRGEWCRLKCAKKVIQSFRPSFAKDLRDGFILHRGHTVSPKFIESKTGLSNWEMISASDDLEERMGVRMEDNIAEELLRLYELFNIHQVSKFREVYQKLLDLDAASNAIDSTVSEWTHEQLQRDVRNVFARMSVQCEKASWPPQRSVDEDNLTRANTPPAKLPSMWKKILFDLTHGEKQAWDAEKWDCNVAIPFIHGETVKSARQYVQGKKEKGRFLNSPQRGDHDRWTRVPEEHPRVFSWRNERCRNQPRHFDARNREVNHKSQRDNWRL